MIFTFREWMNYHDQMINEAALWTHPHEPGDLVFFGVHALGKASDINNAEALAKHSGRIVYVDPSKDVAYVSPPQSFGGYRQARRNEVRRSQKAEDGTDLKGTIRINLTDLRNASESLGDSSGPTIWMVLGNDYRRKKAGALARKRQDQEDMQQWLQGRKRAQRDDPQADTPQARNVRSIFQQKDEPYGMDTSDPVYQNIQRMFHQQQDEPVPSSDRFPPQNRPPLSAYLRNRKTQSFVPQQESLGKYGRYWKTYSESVTYNYYPTC